jgi:hypothetical protein
MPSKSYKALLAAAMLLLFIGVSFTQSALVRDRETLGLNRYTELRGAPPVLALTTVAFGGFRGLISNVLWIRATELQEQNKYFEMVQLADWITKLEPHFSQVWVMQGWNMAFNISVEFSDPADRWRWVERGMALMRDDGLRYNPYDVTLHQELGWLFEFKMGGNMDDAQMLYKQAWSAEMYKVFEADRPNWDELMNPKTDDARRRAALLRDKYKMDPQLMKRVDDKYGPLEWRLPEAHAIYWAVEGLEMAAKNERRVNPDDLVKLRRIVYQSMNLAFQRGRLVTLNAGGGAERVVDLGPNLAMIPSANGAYEDAIEHEEPRYREGFCNAQRYFLRDAVFFLYLDAREPDANRWYQYLAQKYPDKPLLDADTNSLPGNTSLQEYAIGRIEEEAQTLGEYKTRYMLEGLERKSLRSLARGDDSQADWLHRLAQNIWNRYDRKIQNLRNAKANERLFVAPLPEIRADVLRQLLSGELSPEETAILATKTGQTNIPPPAARQP